MIFMPGNVQETIVFKTRYIYRLIREHIQIFLYSVRLANESDWTKISFVSHLYYWENMPTE